MRRLTLVLSLALAFLPGCSTKPVLSPCPFCKQTGKVACVKCRGAKVEACWRCDGRGVACCPACEGKPGTTVCEKCKADSPANVCKTCAGTGKKDCTQCVDGKSPEGRTCSLCAGRGTHGCTLCHQRTGKLKPCLCCKGQKATPEIRAAHPGDECKICKATGSIDCRTCRGSTLMGCSHCKGTGKIERKGSSGSSRRWSFDD